MADNDKVRLGYGWHWPGMSVQNLGNVRSGITIRLEIHIHLEVRRGPSGHDGVELRIDASDSTANELSLKGK